MMNDLACDPQSRALALAASRDDVLLGREAAQLGLTAWALAGLRRASGLRVARGAVALPPVRDPVRTTARATQLLLPTAVISHITAARLSGLLGLRYWSDDERVDATVPGDATRWQRTGVRLHFASLRADEVVDVGGLQVTSLPRTLVDCARILDRAAFVAVMDSALHQRLLNQHACEALSSQVRRKATRLAAQWVALTDGRSESPSETTVRLVLTDAQLAPEELQLDVFTAEGFHVARLDMAWTRHGKKVGLEVDSANHDLPRALYRDRERLNALRAMGWDVRQVTARDAERRPGYIVAQVRQALSMQ